MPAPASGPCSLRRAVVVALALAASAAGVFGLGRAPAAERPACPQQRLTSGYTNRVERALRSGRDVWGEALLAAPGGPTYAGARRYLTPLLLARARKRTPLTESGVYYLPLAQPQGVQGAGSVALHVADGSQILSQRADGRRLTVSVGARGRERYGSCLARLVPARLADGFLPIVETGYVDAAGARYVQESFAARVSETRSLVSFVRLTVDARRSTAPTTHVRFTPSVSGLTRDGNRLVRAGATYAVFDSSATFDGSSLLYRVPRGGTATAYVAWLTAAAPSRPLTLDETAYGAAREAVAEYWQRRLAEGAAIEVPEKRVHDAARGLLIQNLALTWRYSIGNPYEQFSFPESVDVAQVMGEWGFGGVERAILRTSLTRRPRPYPNWKMGEKLLGSAAYYSLFRDREYVQTVTPELRRYVAILARQLGSSRALLGRERYSSDIPDSVYGLHSQAVAWQGLRSMGRVWAETGQGALATRSRRLAARLGAGLRRAVRASQRQLPDGSLFIPVRLLDGERPYEALTASRAGSYWNLVMPYALASGLFRPHGPQARGVLRYMLTHGSRLLGIVRAGAYALYRDPVYPTSGTDHVYGINVARFLADNDEADQLVLSLYGALAAAMTPETFVSGEAATVAPLAGGYHRAMYLPPNGASNAAFLATLRLMLVHETRGADGTARGLKLAFATPRAWLRPGGRIAVRGVPTSFGPVSFALESDARAVRAALELPTRPRPRTLRLRLRLPRGNRVTGVMVNGRPLRRFEPRTETIDLSGLSGSLQLVVAYARRTS